MSASSRREVISTVALGLGAGAMPAPVSAKGKMLPGTNPAEGYTVGVLEHVDAANRSLESHAD